MGKNIFYVTSEEISVGAVLFFSMRRNDIFTSERICMMIWLETGTFSIHVWEERANEASLLNFRQ